MTEHITEFLNAYHDGELRGRRLRQVDEHLSACAGCRAELEALKELSVLLHETDPTAEFLSAERFVANLALNLPRREEHAQPRNMHQIAWWLVPVGLLAAWVFIDITASLSTVMAFAANSGLFEGQLAWLQGDPLQMRWFTTALNLFGEQLGGIGIEALGLLNVANVFIAGLTRQLIPQLMIVVTYLGWMGAWWLREQPTTLTQRRNDAK